MKKLWQGAFVGAQDDVVRFNSTENIELDSLLVIYDILGSIAHAKMLAKQGIIEKNEYAEISKALSIILAQCRCGSFKLDATLEDVHTNVEAAVSKLTPAGKKMHIARSRNDQILVDLRMYMREELLDLVSAIIDLQNAFATLSSKDGLMVGYTHTRVAQPIMISFWADAQVQSLNRDIERLFNCYDRINSNPLGAGAIAGSGWNIDRKYTAKLLGFDSVQENELDAISSRGEMEAEFLSCLSILMIKLSGLAEELIWLSQKGLILIPDKFCTGSSMMPNKKNPDVLESIRARAAKVMSFSQSVLIIKKGLIPGYHSDLIETKGSLVSGITITKGSLLMMAKLISSLNFDEKNIKSELENGYAQATEIADALARNGVPFRDAHALVGKLVNKCRLNGIPLSAAPPLATLGAKAWSEATSLSRKRLKRTIKLDQKYAKIVAAKGQKLLRAYVRLEKL